ncbi:GNAT family N-acetyltransferase [Ornithinibacillus scapharcae]|uniref:GNAT family N-acetyltransferase n=1 Tax=Ornithinibacillus scapharcae TaxID=1147159 RepID=UPI000225BF2F|nr:GNAT family N-acetyltransferase [Ornithinibacillus scapharcae]
MFRTQQFDEYYVRIATEEDLVSVLEILKTAAKWVQSKGVNQWGYLLSGGEDDEIKDDLLAGKTYIIQSKDGDPVATFNFSNEQNEWDIEMWGKREDRAFYIHRLAVSQVHHHKQVGKRLLKWIDENIVLDEGYIRLDCVGNNSVLNLIYQDAGFEHVGYVGEGEDKFSLYEKWLG